MTDLLGLPYKKYITWSDDKFLSHFKKIKLFSHGMTGDAWRAKTKKNKDIVIKVMYKCKKHENEIEIHKKLDELKSPFFPAFYKAYQSKNIRFYGEKVGRRYKGVVKCYGNWDMVTSGPGYIVCMEDVGTPLTEYMNKVGISKKLLFMMLLALYQYRFHIKMYHNDAYPTNFIMKKIKRSNIKVTFNKKRYVIKNVEDIPVLIDYGKSTNYLVDYDYPSEVHLMIDSLIDWMEKPPKWLDILVLYKSSKKMIETYFMNFLHPE